MFIFIMYTVYNSSPHIAKGYGRIGKSLRKGKASDQKRVNFSIQLMISQGRNEQEPLREEMRWWSIINIHKIMNVGEFKRDQSFMFSSYLLLNKCNGRLVQN